MDNRIDLNAVAAGAMRVSNFVGRRFMQLTSVKINVKPRVIVDDLETVKELVNSAVSNSSRRSLRHS